MHLKLTLEQLFMGQQKRPCCNKLKEGEIKVLWEPQGSISY